jgi:hypothetical protein
MQHSFRIRLSALIRALERSQLPIAKNRLVDHVALIQYPDPCSDH